MKGAQRPDLFVKMVRLASIASLRPHDSLRIDAARSGMVEHTLCVPHRLNR